MLAQLRSFPNLLTLLRLSFIPFVVSSVLDGRYGIALTLFVLAGISDGLDGLLARALGQRTKLGEYLDPIADKLLISTLFLVLSVMHRVPWRVTAVVFGRDIIILVVCALVYMTTPLRDFSPTLYGKANTVAQIVTLGATLLAEVQPLSWVMDVKKAGLWTVFGLTIFSALHYVYLLGVRLRAVGADRPAQRSA
ncbi:MAG: CDP-alcohol phosphatidyltransferase family protein [Acidobacteria bacterium]|nr:CDP-alcohol phosphatidyltransferase family protein [Acidobacteriota bacterium]MBV9145360.1 CDP-alcohol phosphatidyltransferase family protein [Acidobacteriota bacterium]MBV9437072.1 CDP-alcohol phosphatidyltransferase family protein [Acidobacteriota bacterium]